MGVQKMERQCKNKKCKKVLPKGYKFKYCENCMNNRAHNTKKAIKILLGTAGVVFLGGKGINHLGGKS